MDINSISIQNLKILTPMSQSYDCYSKNEIHFIQDKKVNNQNEIKNNYDSNMMVRFFFSKVNDLNQELKRKIILTFNFSKG
jgi:hypothetical protein